MGDMQPIETISSINIDSEIDRESINHERITELMQEEEWRESEKLYEELELKRELVDEIREKVSKENKEAGDLVQKAWREITPEIERKLAQLNLDLKEKDYSMEEITQAIFLSREKRENNSNK